MKWTLKVLGTTIDIYLTKVLARPQSTDTSVTVSFEADATVDLKALWDWVCVVYDFAESQQPVDFSKVPKEEIDKYLKTLLLTCSEYEDGKCVGRTRFTLYEAWPKAIDWGELDHSSNDICEINITFVYRDFVESSLPVEDEI